MLALSRDMVSCFTFELRARGIELLAQQAEMRELTGQLGLASPKLRSMAAPCCISLSASSTSRRSSFPYKR
jgi:hypothetical protein